MNVLFGESVLFRHSEEVWREDNYFPKWFDMTVNIVSVPSTASFQNQRWQETTGKYKVFCKNQEDSASPRFPDWALQVLHFGIKGKRDYGRLYNLLILMLLI